MSLLSSYCSGQFQSTLPRRERPDIDQELLQENYISIHAPAKGATQPGLPAGGGLGISIHAPAKGATDDRPFRTVHDFISIHAPAKGATAALPPVGQVGDISIHAPAKGATGFLLVG